jgi:hypothetical protein
MFRPCSHIHSLVFSWILLAYFHVATSMEILYASHVLYAVSLTHHWNWVAKIKQAHFTVIFIYLFIGGEYEQ